MALLGVVEKMQKTYRDSRWTVKVTVVSKDSRSFVAHLGFKISDFPIRFPRSDFSLKWQVGQGLCLWVVGPSLGGLLSQLLWYTCQHPWLGTQSQGIPGAPFPYVASIFSATLVPMESPFLPTTPPSEDRGRQNW